MVRNNIGFLLSQSSKLDEAIKWYEESIKLWDKYPNAYYNLAEALEKKGKYAEAVVNFEMCIKLAPKSPRNAKTLERIKRLSKAEGKSEWDSYF